MNQIAENIQSRLKRWKNHAQVELVLKTLSIINKFLQDSSLQTENPPAYQALNEKIHDFHLQVLKISESFKELKQTKIEDLQVIHAKLEVFLEILNKAEFSGPDDFGWHDFKSSRWEELENFVEVVESSNSEKTKKQYQEFVAKVSLGQAFVMNGLQETSRFKRNLMVGLSAMYYFFNKKSAERKKDLSYAVADPKCAITTWNLLDSWLCSKAIKALLPKTSENILIYIPRTARHVSSGELARASGSFSMEPLPDHVQVRLLNFSPLFNNSNDSSFCCGSREKPLKRARKVIFHIHGGGFISQSSQSHQMATCMWTNELKVPVFSVDYRLAPQNPFPDGLDDVWQAYNWLLSNHEDLGIKLKKIVVVGDSAGGNLSVVLAIKSALERIKIPDGLLLVYPAVYLDDKLIKKSLFRCFDDDVVPYSFLKICKDLYLQDETFKPSEDFMISPLMACQDLLKLLPSTRVLFGNDDPLRDYVLSFIEKLKNCQVDVKGKLFLDTPHGALNFYFPGGVKKAKHFFRASVEYFRELFN
jgi:hormone-sensitive lipase